MNFNSSLKCRGVKEAPLGERGLESCTQLGAVNTGLPTGENALQYASSLSLNLICASAQYVEGTA